jgi:hypothetical protein
MLPVDDQTALLERWSVGDQSNGRPIIVEWLCLVAGGVHEA